ncbi:unnamed protein product [Bursaphelenchus xylophilus]|uniref:(pine wood nematode) hypothetical protein n=1 Tax=Bursaphelenchus xylophilus TaxID=6326 RepID=A0A1I7SS83_BURXY|nr:unnamed protein product [Bursaphelenchus xylophilus]CAG9097935.1 unnamed protein product [Bursaphelenchus xylophilus]
MKIIALFLCCLTVIDAGLDDEATKIFDYINKNKADKIPVENAARIIEKLLPQSDVKSLDKNGDGKVEKEEFVHYYRIQYNEWAKRNLP